MPSTKVLILYNEPTLPEDHPIAYSEHEIFLTVAEVHKHLSAAGYEVVRVGASYQPETILNALREHRPDAVFNLFEGTAEHGQTEAYAAGLLHWLNIPFTGSPFDTLTVARNKHLTKHLLRGAGLPTPEFLVVDALPMPELESLRGRRRLRWPVIVKPATQDASVGVDQKSVVTDQAALERQTAYLLQTYGPPVLIEELLTGRELTLGLVEAPDLRLLPFSEINFVPTEGHWPIVTYDAKWKPESRDYNLTPPDYPAKVEPRLAERLGRLARQAYRLLGCRDYARVDFRLSAAGKPYILEVNPNPDFSPEAGFVGASSSVGLTHAGLTVQLVENALARGGNNTITWTGMKDGVTPRVAGAVGRARPAPRKPRRRRVAQ